MNIEELMPLPDPAGVLNTGTMALRAFTADQLRAYGEAVAAAVAKRCAEICERDVFDGWDCADAIRREFGEVSK